jgi:hypothetical protein
MDITAQYNRSDFLNFLSNRFLPDDFETADETVRPEKANALYDTNFSIEVSPPDSNLFITTSSVSGGKNRAKSTIYGANLELLVPRCGILTNKYCLP